MKLQKLTCPALSKAKNIDVSRNFVVATTGSAVTIADRNFQILQRIENLPHGYYVRISPDETQVLLVSTAPLFYVISLQDYSVRKCVLKKEYAENLEGRAVWSPDGKEIVAAVMNKHSLCTAIRTYDAADLSVYRQTPDLDLTAFSICYVPEYGQYLLAGRDTVTQSTPTIAWFDGQNVTQYAVRGFDDVFILRAQYDSIANAVAVFGVADAALCEKDGTLRQKLSVKQSKPETVAPKGNDPFGLSDLLDDEAFKKIQKLAAMLEDDDVEPIFALCRSADDQWLFVGTDRRVLVYDKDMKEQMCEHSTFDVTQLSFVDGYLLVGTSANAALFRLC